MQKCFTTNICKVKYNPCVTLTNNHTHGTKSYFQILSSIIIHKWTKELEFKTTFILLDMPHTPLR